MTESLLGTLAAGMTTGAWIPQLVRTWRSRSAHDLSWVYLLTMLAGLGAWLLYGVLRKDLALVLANSVTLSFVLVLSLSKAATGTRGRRP